MTCQPLLDHRLAIIRGTIHVKDDLLRFGLGFPNHSQEIDKLLAIDVVSRQAIIQIVVSVGVIGADDVQTLATRPHAHQQTLSQQQPAAINQVHAPHRVAGIDIQADRQRLSRTTHFTAVAANSLDEGALLLAITFPQESTDLMEGDANAREKIFKARQGVDNLELFLNPGANPTFRYMVDGVCG